MVNFILNSFLLFLLVGIVSSADSSTFGSVAENNGFIPSTDLRGSFSQQNANTQGFHKADVYFKTKIPSLNPDQSGVSSINCNDGKITLGLKEQNDIDQINNWPDKVILLISDKWECFGKTETQFFIVSDKVIDAPNKSVSFTSEESKISDQADEFLINVSWVDGGSKKRNVNRRRSRKRAQNLDISKKLNLNVLFDEKTGKSSKPNIPLIKLGQNNTEETLLCANCFVNGEATINMIIGGKFFPFKLTDATISVKGNIKMNLDFSINGKVGASLSPPDIQLLSIPLSPLGISNLFNIGPSIDLGASASITADITGTLRTGGEIDIPNFSANFTLIDEPKFVQSGFDPQTKSHDPTVGVTISTGISGSLKPQLSFGLDVLNGLFQIKTGFQVKTTLGTSVSIGSESGCNGNDQPHLESTLVGDLGFFVAKKDFPIVNLPSVTLLDKCVPKVV
ncbi:hypothetical protein RhiirA5_460238 [Rhizophagus irregularis]|uniref:Apple protein n=3 Tax=Rhizophagus irregularis TaxID=588596 RepID=U9TF45_RHIID|nr:hypothetical protein GLOIN_2v1558212 [Rhizophagus irregularis DAOM 181602=DAOM 197198]EXX58756.1 hypothetical protein RirG_194970 [Rhizophagus irregularis DAOM 197198w]PKC13245.1 hypothetical protein RhiirA5_460238 [Rhizophagus irregularis]PKC63021.1 hypothetical protein RhiirA1_538063 [Rhizophagus irregularis]PKY26786.1 hypothetical protein RhiirB3_528812 [Rhizophagus irregularis]POG76286.1 hypothetical protein GLOIN_2v1558212 [Rhizophagus irregularis DAOM 181602=DAOM 197198]|eukprot:XP_025183152.1 hypothetical protein GLOIN_2v1558212 [Rhizophagus irregularis DAOM 181602=DAOM 197198]